MKNTGRIVAAALIALVLVNSFFFVLFDPTAIVITGAVIFSLGIILLTLIAWKVIASPRKSYILNVAFFLVPSSYIIAGLILSFLFAILEACGIINSQSALKYFILIQAVPVALLLWRLIALGIAKDEIEQVDQTVAASRKNWDLLTIQVKAIKVSDAEAAKTFKRLCESFRYADPISIPEISGIEEQILAQVNQLQSAAAGNDAAAVINCCTGLQDLLTTRANMIKALK